MDRDYDYVTEQEYGPEKKRIEMIIARVRELVKPYFSFHHTYVGSTDRGLITRDKKNRTGYDFDVNIHVNAKAKQYSPEKIKEILLEAFNKCSSEYGYLGCRDGKRVFTIERKPYINSNEIVSCDFAIVNDWYEGQQRIILRDNNQNTYRWDKQPNTEKHIETMADWLKQHDHWEEVRKEYIVKKNTNENPFNKSRSLYASTINEVYMLYNGSNKKPRR